MGGISLVFGEMRETRTSTFSADGAGNLPMGRGIPYLEKTSEI
jgi:hypothetical protein